MIGAFISNAHEQAIIVFGSGRLIPEEKPSRPYAVFQKTRKYSAI